jgi:hypothetical protein
MQYKLKLQIHENTEDSFCTVHKTDKAKQNEAADEIHNPLSTERSTVNIGKYLSFLSHTMKIQLLADMLRKMA